MFKEELNNLERYTQELEAVKNYAKIKEERDSSLKENAQLKDQLNRTEVQLRNKISEIEQLSLQLDKSEAAVKELSVSLDETRKELSSLRDFRMKLPKDTVLSLDETKTHFLKAQEKEIESRVEARLVELEKELRSQMPAMVRQKSLELIKQPELSLEIKEVIDSRAKEVADDCLRDKDRWPDWFKENYFNAVNELVSRKLDTEFERRVRVEAEKRLEQLKAGEWKEYAAAKARALSTGLKGLLGELQGSWCFTCDRCGRNLAIDLRASDIAPLLGGQTINITCTTCLDPAVFPFILSTVQHKVASLTLGTLLELYMSSAPP